jgi:multidrug efflux pump subunit AcrA (membrane-fusion protein)
VQIATAPSRTVIAIPSTAVQYSDNGRFVYIITPAEKGELRAKARPVTTGEERNRYVLIDSGLTVGEHIATDGAYKLHDGMLVYTKDAVK